MRRFSRIGRTVYYADYKFRAWLHDPKLASSSGIHTVGRFECSGQASGRQLNTEIMRWFVADRQANLLLLQIGGILIDWVRLLNRIWNEGNVNADRVTPADRVNMSSLQIILLSLIGYAYNIKLSWDYSLGGRKNATSFTSSAKKKHMFIRRQTKEPNFL